MPQLRRESGKGAKLAGKVKVGSSSEGRTQTAQGPGRRLLRSDVLLDRPTLLHPLFAVLGPDLLLFDHPVELLRVRV